MRRVSGNFTRGFNRLFIVLAVCWAVFWLVIFPFVAARQGGNHDDADRKFCYDYYGAQFPNGARLQTCLADAEKEFASGLYSGFSFSWGKGEYWSFKGYYRHMGWWLVGLILIAPPVAYGLAWGAYGLAQSLRAVCQWIWRGFRAVSAN